MTETTTKSPAQIVIERFGGVVELGKTLNIDKSTVSRWQCGPDKKGTNGRVPQKYWKVLIVEARKRKLRLSLKELAGI